MNARRGMGCRCARESSARTEANGTNDAVGRGKLDEDDDDC